MHRLLTEPSIAEYVTDLGAPVVKAAIDEVLRHIRNGASSNGAAVPSYGDILTMVELGLAHEATHGLVEVLNGTGVMLHTNLGRAPLADEALDAMRRIAGGYSNLEFDLETGTRGSRYERVSSLLRATTGAEDGLVVNNCAAAMLLILDTFANGREVVVARNELIEIGGGFRMPDVLQRSDARLVEVGTTNKVYAHDFEAALSPDTALLLRAHMSNYRIEGFVAAVAPSELVAVGHRVGVPVIEDLGSGALVDLAQFGLPHERMVQEAVADGVDLVAFSGDKLLGGPQAGIIVGRAALIARLRSNALLRALRVDKATLAALAATLLFYTHAAEPERIPLLAMLAETPEVLTARAGSIVKALRRTPAVVEAVNMDSHVGGGSLPQAKLGSAGLSIRPKRMTVESLIGNLHRSKPPLVARREHDAVLIDLRTIPAQRDGDVVTVVQSVLGG